MESDLYQACHCGSGKKYKFCCRVREREEKRKAACGLCGKTGNLTKTECCGNWICDDKADYQLFSFARNSCFRNHRRQTLCSMHYNEDHGGQWQDCTVCREDIAETEMYVWYGTNEYNFEKLRNPPAYEPTHCSQCGMVILLGEDGYTQKGDEYLCERCGEKMMSNLWKERKGSAERESP